MNEFLESWQEKSNRIVVFAGIFDPVHKGHISAVKEALRYGKQAVILPERVPKTKKPIANYGHRLAMLRIAVAQEPDIEVLDYSLNQHLIEPVFKWLREQYPNSNFVWMVGGDVVGYIESWPDSDKLQDLGVAEIIVVRRATDDLTKRSDEVCNVPVHYITRFMRKHEKLSSSFIREDLPHRHTSLPDGVYEYIKENSLYIVGDASSSNLL